MPIKPELTAQIDGLLGLDLSDPSNALAFRRGIAELAGWEILNSEGKWNLYNPERIYWSFARAGVNSLEEAWNYFAEHDYFRYPDSVDEALTLPLPSGWTWAISREGDHYWGDIWKRRVYADDEPDFHYQAPGPAEAYCKAWLRYRLEEQS